MILQVLVKTCVTATTVPLGTVMSLTKLALLHPVELNWGTAVGNAGVSVAACAVVGSGVAVDTCAVAVITQGVWVGAAVAG